MYISMDDRVVNFSKRGTEKHAVVGFDSGEQMGGGQIGLDSGNNVGVSMVHGLQDAKFGMDEKLARSEISLFRGSAGRLKGDGEYDDVPDDEQDDGEDELDPEDEGDDDDDDDDDDADDPGVSARRAAERVAGRSRRAAVFGKDGSLAEENGLYSDADSDDDLGMDGDHGEGLGVGAADWKRGLNGALQKTRQKSLMEMVYDDDDGGDGDSGDSENDSGNDSDEDDGDALFKKATDDHLSSKQDQFDRSKFLTEVVSGLDLTDPALRNRFVTGDWSAAKSRDAKAPRAEGDESGDDDDGAEVYGDFEDLETGEKFDGTGTGEAEKGGEGEEQDEDGDGDDSEDGGSGDDSESEGAARRRAEKIAKKEQVRVAFPKSTDCLPIVRPQLLTHITKD